MTRPSGQSHLQRLLADSHWVAKGQTRQNSIFLAPTKTWQKPIPRTSESDVWDADVCRKSRIWPKMHWTFGVTVSQNVQQRPSTIPHGPRITVH